MTAEQQVEEWARARGYWNDTVNGWDAPPMPPWIVHKPHSFNTNGYLQIAEWPDAMSNTGGRVWKLRPADALRWCLNFDVLATSTARAAWLDKHALEVSPPC